MNFYGLEFCRHSQFRLYVARTVLARRRSKTKVVAVLIFDGFSCSLGSTSRCAWALNGFSVAGSTYLEHAFVGLRIRPPCTGAMARGLAEKNSNKFFEESQNEILSAVGHEWQCQVSFCKKNFLFVPIHPEAIFRYPTENRSKYLPYWWSTRKMCRSVAKENWSLPSHFFFIFSFRFSKFFQIVIFLIKPTVRLEWFAILLEMVTVEI